MDIPWRWLVSRNGLRYASVQGAGVPGKGNMERLQRNAKGYSQP